MPSHRPERIAEAIREVVSTAILFEVADPRIRGVTVLRAEVTGDLRNATVYGVSPRLRGDLVVNNLVGWAHATGRVLLKSDGSPWRPLVHVEDVSRAFLAVLEAPRDAIHGEAFNVGRSGENYRVKEVAEMVRAVVPGSRIEIETTVEAIRYRAGATVVKTPFFNPARKTAPLTGS